MKKSLALIPAAALIAALALTGCSTTGHATADKAPAAAAATTPAKKSTTAKLGETFKYDDGLTITVGAPAAYTPSASAAGATQAQQIALTFTLTNGTAENLNPIMLPQVTSNGTQATPIIDIENTAIASFAPTAVILPGGHATWTQAFSVSDPANLVVQLSPALKYGDAIFTNGQ
jgi:hypothetical protein